MAVYNIYSLAQLQAMRPGHLADDCILHNDINASGFGFDPVGDNANRFTGTFDGLGHTITGLTVNQPAEDYVGLFGYTEGADYIRNVTLVNANVTGRDYVGALIGFCQYVTDVTQCHSSGSVNGRDRVGGLIGWAMGGLGFEVTIRECSSWVDVTATGDYVGGLVGYLFNGSEVWESKSYGDVIGDDKVGGLVGIAINASDINNCYSHSSVNGNDMVGGLVGLLGSGADTSQIRRSYSNGAVTGNTNVGGLLGSISPFTTTFRCHWDRETSGQVASAGTEVGHTTAEMQLQSTFDNPPAMDWDFVNIWEICAPHPLLVYTGPLLQWQDLPCSRYPGPPTGGQVNGKSSSTGPTGECVPAEIDAKYPTFSAIYNDPDVGDIAIYYRIQVNTASDFLGTMLWNPGKTLMNPVNEGERCEEIAYAGLPLSADTTYYWRIKFWDDEDNESAWSAVWCFISSLTEPHEPTDHPSFYPKYRLEIGKYIIQCEADKQNLLDCNFTLRRDGGCAEFDFKIGAPDFTIALGDEVVIYLFGDPNPWFRGRILEIDEEGSSSRIRHYSGYGHVEFLNGCDLVDITYGTGYAINDLRLAVIDVLDKFIRPHVPATLYSGDGGIQDPSYTITEMSFDKVKPIDALTDLCELAYDAASGLRYEFGVDEAGDFFFRPNSSSILERKWVGKHIATFLPKKNMRKLVNMWYLEGGNLSGGLNYITTVSDGGSIGTWGLRADKATIPSGLDATEIAQWGNDLLATLKDPITKAQITGIDIERTKTLIRPRGLIRITSEDGKYKLDLRMLRVTYHVRDKGITADIELGEKVASVYDPLKILEKRVKKEQEQLASDVKQLATGILNLLDPWGGLESWSVVAPAPPDGWTLVGAGPPTVAREAGIVKHGNFSAKLTRVGADCYLQHQVQWWSYYQSRTLTLGCWVYATVADRARITVWDGVGPSSSSAYHVGDSTWHYLIVTHKMAAGASELTVRLECNTVDADVYFDGAILVEGGNCPTYVPSVRPVFLSAVMTDPNWDGDPRGDEAPTVLNLSAFGNGCPPGIKSVLLHIQCRDSASLAGGGLYFGISPDGANYPLTCRPDGIPNDSLVDKSAWVLCDANGDVQYAINASAAGCMDCWIEVYAYILTE